MTEDHVDAKESDRGTKSGARATLRCPFCLSLNRVDVSRAADRPKCGSCGRPLLLDRPVQLRDEDFDRLIGDAEVPVLVDFYADWCGPCKMMAPLLDDLARERSGEMLVAKVDTEANPRAPRRFGVRGIPTLVMFLDGRETGRAVGAIPADRLGALADEALASVSGDGGEQEDRTRTETKGG